MSINKRVIKRRVLRNPLTLRMTGKITRELAKIMKNMKKLGKKKAQMVDVNKINHLILGYTCQTTWMMRARQHKIKGWKA